LGGVGRAGYDPDLLLGLLIYAYALGVRSSRRIEQLCWTDVAFRIICADDPPDHSVIARFRQRHQAALEELLEQSLVLCARLGLIRLGVVALDGTKIAANAAKAANRSESHLRELARTWLDEAAAADEAEDAEHGEARGDELPAGLRDRSGRKQRIRAALEQIAQRKAEQAEDRAQADAVGEAYAASMAADTPRRGMPPKTTDPVVAAAGRLERERRRAAAQIADWQVRADAAAQRGRRLPGKPPAPVEDQRLVKRARAALEQAQATQAAAAAAAAAARTQAAPQTGPDDGQTKIKANLTDPDSRVMPTRNGWIQGYNCQLSVSADQIILAVRATTETGDDALFKPMLKATVTVVRGLRRTTGRKDLKIGTMLADAGYGSRANLTCPGPDRLIALAKGRDLEAAARTSPATGPPGEDADPREQMAHRLRTPEGVTTYRKRGATVEPVNGHLKDRRGLRTFARRGLAAVQSELAFTSAVHNILKIYTTRTNPAPS
jgi:hypothetical protein